MFYPIWYFVKPFQIINLIEIDTLNNYNIAQASNLLAAIDT